MPTAGPAAVGVVASSVAPRAKDSAEVRARVRAVEAWGQSGDVEGVAGCLEALDDPDGAVRHAAIGTLARFEPAVVFRAVLDVLVTGSARDVRALDEALPMLRASLEAPMLGVLRAGGAEGLSRPAAAYALGRMGSVAAGPLLADLAWSEDTELAVLCAEAMVSTASEAAVPGYIALTQHPNPDLRMAATHALGRTEGPRTAAALEEVAFGVSEPTREVREAAVTYLGNVGDGHAVPRLVSAMRRYAWIRPAAAVALRRLTGAALGTSPEEWEQWLETAPPLAEDQATPFAPGEDAGVPPDRVELDFPVMGVGDLFPNVPGLDGTRRTIPEPGAQD